MRAPKSLARTGAVGTVLVILAVIAIVGYKSVPILRTGNEYHAIFGDASALDSGDDVQIAGIPVGEVTAVELDGTQVRVSFTVTNRTSPIGDGTRASVKVGTVLGQRHLELNPQGDCCLEVGATIPRQRTTSGYDITDSLGELAQTAGDTDVPDLSRALDVTSDLSDAASPHLRSALEGLQKLSAAVNARDTQLLDLLESSHGLTEILEKRNLQMVTLFTDGRTLLAELNARSQAIHGVLVEGQRVSEQLTGLATDNERTLGPSLRELRRTLDLLNRNQRNIDEAISGLSNFATQLDDIVANGPFFSALIHNVLPADLNGQKPYSPGAPR